MPMLIFGVALVVIAGLLWWARSRNAKAIDDVAGTELSACSEINHLHQQLYAELGMGRFQSKVATRGFTRAAANAPALIAPHSQQPCVWYRSQTTAIRREHHQDSNGVTSTEDRQQVVADESSQQVFLLEDQGSFLAIDPLHADVQHARQVVDRHDKADFSGTSIEFGNLRINRNQGEVTGYQIREWIIPLNQELYVRAEASDRRGWLCLEKPQDKSSFILSTQSYAEVLSSLQTRHKIMTVAGLGLAITGTLLFLAGLAQSVI